MLRFLAHDNLAKLCRYLRFLGYDAETCSGDFYQLAARALRENRVLLTRQKQHPEFTGLRAITLASDSAREQLVQLDKELGIRRGCKPFTRCPVCNVQLVPVEKPRVLGSVPPFVYATQSNFKKCPECGRIYWPGTHILRLRKLLGI